MCLAMENWKKEIIAESLEIGEKRGLEKGLEKGISIGEDRGISKEKIAIAKTLISEGSLSLETIAKVTELSMEEILSFKQIVVN